MYIFSTRSAVLRHNALQSFILKYCIVQYLERFYGMQMSGMATPVFPSLPAANERSSYFAVDPQPLQDDGDSNTPLIAGVAGGVGCLLLLGAATAFFVVRNRRKKRAKAVGEKDAPQVRRGKQNRNSIVLNGQIILWSFIVSLSSCFGWLMYSSHSTQSVFQHMLSLRFPDRYST